MAKSATPCDNPQPITTVSFNDYRQVRCAGCDFPLVPSPRPDGTLGWTHPLETPVPAKAPAPRSGGARRNR